MLMSRLIDLLTDIYGTIMIVIVVLFSQVLLHYKLKKASLCSVYIYKQTVTMVIHATSLLRFRSLCYQLPQTDKRPEQKLSNVP